MRGSTIRKNQKPAPNLPNPQILVYVCAVYGLLIKGFLLGLTLSFMIGPLFFSVVEATLERGTRAGLALASGIWASDLGFIFVVERGLRSIEALVAVPGFRFWAGVVGGGVLVAFGVGSWLKARAATNANATEQQILMDEKGWWGPLLRGFVINTLNPGTLIFWLGTATGIVVPNGWSTADMSLFFGAMMSVLVVTDVLKVYGAKRLRQWLTPSHILLVRRTIGAVLLAFGLFMWVEAGLQR
jgi:threonine/homoserine/homoserine lactone efflux protein